MYLLDGISCISALFYLIFIYYTRLTFRFVYLFDIFDNFQCNFFLLIILKEVNRTLTFEYELIP